MDWILVLILVLIMCVREVAYWKERQERNLREFQLINRVMSRSFGEFAAGTHRLETKPDAPVTSKERMKKESLEFQHAMDTYPVD